jgi:nucleoside 2-deoxyribosyltransferase
MKFYLAGSISPENRTLMVRLAQKLRRNWDYYVYCPWELKIDNAWSLSQDNWAEKVFESDCKAIIDCDIFILITPGRESTSGSNFEEGLAYGLNKRIVVFQITDQPTSLMTYCASTNFYNCSRENIMDKFETFMTELACNMEPVYFDDNKGYCETTLT